MKVLDKGYLTKIETWGSDERIVEAARMSTNKGFQGWGPSCTECGYAKGDEHDVGCSRPETWRAGDEKLLQYLYGHKHSTPFEMAGMIVEVQAPIFVFREWHRHRTQSYNEMSARYIQMPDLHFVPTAERVRKQDSKNKQATGEEKLPEEIVEEWLSRIASEQKAIYETYEWALAWGVPKELARINTPVSRFSRMRASANLRNWLGFLTLRNEPGAQEEIRVYAQAVDDLLTESFPRTMNLFHGGNEK